MRTRLVGLTIINLVATAIGCSGAFDSSGGDAGVGGGAPAGGMTGTGGASSKGGTGALGGTASTGGTVGIGGGTGTACSQNCVSGGFVCCNTTCRNTDNDPNNCGSCGTVCPSSTPVCQGGDCVAINCTAELGPPGTVCCGAAWCASGQLCCMVSGPVVSDVPSCLNPVDGTCPRGCKLCVCANPNTPIDTPNGSRKISELNLGDLIYSVDHDQVVAVPIIDIKRRPALGHVVPQIALSNGQILQISDQHPTADGRIFGELHEGDSLGGLRIVSVERVTYEQPYTYDILPASDTGYYFAGGAMIGSTLAANPVSPYYHPGLPLAAH